MTASSDPERWSHSHSFIADTSTAERRTRVIVGVTGAMMIAEIAAGSIFGSMALLADGWHMGTHVLAFLIAMLAYRLQRRFAGDPSFSFGTGKFVVLGAYTSAVLLGGIALLMAAESLHRLFAPASIRFNQALVVALAGLLINLLCALLLRGVHGHAHPPDGPHAHAHTPTAPHAHDPNLRAAYLHVLADALTSVTAILALAGGRWLGWGWLDPAMGLLGSAIVAWWAIGLLRDTGAALLDRTPGASSLPQEIRRAAEGSGQVVTDLHVWQIGSGRFAAIVSVAGPQPAAADAIRARLSAHAELVHLTVETRAGPAE